MVYIILTLFNDSVRILECTGLVAYELDRKWMEKSLHLLIELYPEKCLKVTRKPLDFRIPI
jgi:hypothetical protein